jgi:hypothetical protein
VICAVRVGSKVELQKLIARIQKEVPHIQGTVTAIVASLY